VSGLTDTRDELKAALEESAGAATLGQVLLVEPDGQAVPPLVFVGPGEPYVTFDYEGRLFGHVLVNLEVVCFAGAGVNEVTAAQLDDMVLAVLAAVPDGYVVTDVDRPGYDSLNGQKYPAVVVHVAREIPIGE